MLALKKKREAEKKQAEEAAKAEAAAVASSKTVESPAGAAAPSATGGSGGGQVSLFGIGGEKKSKKGEQTGMKKTPGEIRIQKGKFLYTCQLFVVVLCGVVWCSPNMV
jgi:hypothetical protein